jgi:hypothetical protein
MPPGPSQDIARARLAGRVTPRFRHRLSAFDASAAVRFRSPSSISPAGLQSEPWLQRSPPRLLTAAACSGLSSAPDRRARRALLHLSLSCASRCGPAMLVTHDPKRASRDHVTVVQAPCRTQRLSDRANHGEFPVCVIGSVREPHRPRAILSAKLNSKGYSSRSRNGRRCRV